jgi:hypothetical protein
VTRAISFAPIHNSPGTNAKGQPLKDASEFQNEAHMFASSNGFVSTTVLFDNRQDMHARREQCLSHLRLEADGQTSVFAFFCHGWPDGIQAGFTCAFAKRLAAEIARASTPECRVILYACSNGVDKDKSTPDDRGGTGGDNGFADRLRDELSLAGIAATVYAHTKDGHTTRNPYVRVFEPGVTVGGSMLVDPTSPLWKRWRLALLTGRFRFAYPFLTRAEVEARIA